MVVGVAGDATTRRRPLTGRCCGLLALLAPAGAVRWGRAIIGEAVATTAAFAAVGARASTRSNKSRRLVLRNDASKEEVMSRTHHVIRTGQTGHRFSLGSYETRLLGCSLFVRPFGPRLLLANLATGPSDHPISRLFAYILQGTKRKRKQCGVAVM